MTFSDPATTAFLPVEDASQLPDWDGGNSGDGLGYEPPPVDLLVSGLPASLTELDPGWSASVAPGGEPGAFEESSSSDVGSEPVPDPLTGAFVSGEPPVAFALWSFCADPLALEPSPDSSGLEPASSQPETAIDPLDAVDEPVWRGGDAPLPWWRGAAGVGESADGSVPDAGEESVLYALNLVTEPTGDGSLGPDVQVCYFSLGPTAAVLSDPASSGSQATASAEAAMAPLISPGATAELLPASPVALPVAAPQPASSEIPAASEPSETGDHLVRLLELSQSGSTGVAAPQDWRELIHSA